ncbi:MAG: DUF5685 family protein, partial [Clostridiales bacterium]|nr:DUF5685 family protein [Clostridiales bacterium]
GYVLPDKPNLLMKEYALYRAHYCGACKATGKAFGQLPRLTVNYDQAFLSLFLHDYHDIQSDLKMSNCAFHPFSKMAVLRRSPLADRVNAANILLAYYKAADDRADGGGLGKRAAAGVLKRAYKKAAGLLPGADEIIRSNYARLSELEKRNCARPDEAADCFASILRDLADMLGEGAARHADPEQRGALRGFFYHLGRWVYFADALDDWGEDFRAKRYNPFIAGFDGFADRKAFAEACQEDLKLCFYPSVNQMTQNLAKFNFRMSENLLQNVVFYGIPNMTEKLLAADAKLPRQKI